MTTAHTTPTGRTGLTPGTLPFHLQHLDDVREGGHEHFAVHRGQALQVTSTAILGERDTGEEEKDEIRIPVN